MRFKGPYAILLLTLASVLLWVVTGCGKDTNNEALHDPSGRESGLPPCSTTDTAGDPCEPRDVSNFALFSGNAQGAEFTDEEAGTVEDILEKGLKLAEASPVHLAFRGRVEEGSVRCSWRGVARTPDQRETAVRIWLELDDADPLPSAIEVERRFMEEIDEVDTAFPETAKASFRALARGGVSTEYVFLVCYADYTVLEYLVGAGSDVVTVAYDHIGEARSYDLYARAHDAGEFGDTDLVDEGVYVADLTEAVESAESSMISVLEGRESFLFLAPMGAHHAIAVEAWQVVEQWDLQTDEDDVVHAVRFGVSEGDPEHTQTLINLEDRITAAAESDDFAEERMENVDELDDYYEEIGAYDDITPDDGDTTTFTPAQPPAIPTCANGTAVTDPGDNRPLVHDCEVPLDNRDTLAGTATLDWSADTAISDWEGITTGNNSSRVTELDLSGKSLDGAILPELGTLFELTVLDLSSNSLTGEIPSELGWLYNLTELRLSGNSLTGCIPVALEDVTTNDLSSLGLLYCAPPAPENLSIGTPGEAAMDLSWDAVSNTGKYRVEYRLGRTGDWTTDDDTLTSTSHTVEELVCESEYQFRVSAYGSGTTYTAAWSEPSLLAMETTSTCTPPQFDEASYGFIIPSDTAIGGTVGSVSATEPTGDTISYAIIEGDESGTFAIDGSTGAITLGTSIGDQTPEESTLTVEARDSSLATEVTVEVRVLWPPASLTAEATGNHGFSVGWSAVQDISYYDLRYKENVEGSQNNWVHVSPAATSYGFEPEGGCANTYQFWIRSVLDGVESPATGPVEATCNIAPQFGEASYQFAIREDASVGDVVGSVEATDAEGETLGYSITSGNDDGHFSIDTSSGQITVAGALEYDTSSRYSLTIQAADGSNGTATTTVEIAIRETCAGGTAVSDPENSADLVRDCDALLAARDVLTVNASLDWSKDKDISTWEGVHLTATGDAVAEVRLTDLGLDRSIPVELGELASLRRLDLDDNSLTGSIPPELGNLSGLESVYLNGNSLSGEIPSQLGDLSNLLDLQLHDNQLTGAIPSELGQLSNLIHLVLSYNELEGEIPLSLGNLSSLRSLWLIDNRLSGSIPTQLGDLSNLTRLALSDNQLTGSIPPELGNLTELDLLYLDVNKLSGSIPSSLGGLGKLMDLRLNYNQLTGAIPEELGQLNNLVLFIAANNSLSGSIPASLGNLTALEDLWLRYNRLSGSIPFELEGLANLTRLYLGNNPFTGCIPSGLKDVERKDLGRLNLLYCPPAPTSLAVSSTGATSIDLTWDALSGATGYKLEYRAGSDTQWLVDDDTLGGSSHTVDGLQCDTSYQFRITAFGDGAAYGAYWGSSSQTLTASTATCP